MDGLPGTPLLGLGLLVALTGSRWVWVYRCQLGFGPSLGFGLSKLPDPCLTNPLPSLLYSFYFLPSAQTIALSLVAFAWLLNKLLWACPHFNWASPVTKGRARFISDWVPASPLQPLFSEGKIRCQPSQLPHPHSYTSLSIEPAQLPHVPPLYFPMNLLRSASEPPILLNHKAPLPCACRPKTGTLSITHL